MPFCYTPFHLSALSSLCTHLWHLSINLDTPRTTYRWWHVCFPSGNLPYSLQFLYTWHRTPTNKFFTFDNIRVSEATNQASMEAQCLLRTESSKHKTAWMEQSVTQCRGLTAPFFAVSLSRGFMVRTSLYFYLRTHFRASIWPNAHSVTLYADRSHKFHSNRTINVASQPTHRTSFTSLTTLRPLYAAFDELTITRNFRAYIPYRTSSKVEEDCGKFGKIFVCSRNFKHRFHSNCCFTVHFDKYKTILPTNALFINIKCYNLYLKYLLIGTI